MGIAASGLLSARLAVAADFDEQGRLWPDAQAVLFEGFEAGPWRYLPADSSAECAVPGFTLERPADALEGDYQVRVNVPDGCAERFLVRVPAIAASYRATLWLRHGSLDAQMTVVYPEGSGRELLVAKLAPTGRVTSDGWVELASNEFPVDGTLAERVYLRVFDFADVEGVEVDALELTLAGEYVEDDACTGLADPICGPERLCIYERCRLGRLHMPPLPADEVRDDLVDMLLGQLDVHFGGRKTRLSDLPTALATLDGLRAAPTAWQFWNGWATAVRQLHDWHTGASSGLSGAYTRARRLNLCFIEGEADASFASWPPEPTHLELLVSHTGSDGTLGIRQGDRLVAVDGMDPFAWALSLVDRDWGWWQASDDDVVAEFAERMRGLIVAYATEFTMVHCDATTGSCDPQPVSYRVADLPADGGGQVQCDNRPFYHLEEGNPGPNHSVGWNIFRGRIAETTSEEAIFGMVWDTLYGGGDPNGWVNSQLSAAVEDWRLTARGVILDHRAGNGGTMDSPQLLTRLVRPPATVAVFASPTPFGAWDGPASSSEGVALFQSWRMAEGLAVGADDFDPDLPVALVLHRDGSASDFMPMMMKGAPKVRLFGPHATAGAFSTFHELFYWGGVSLRLATGDTIASDGSPLIGHGVEPDVVVVPKQSDLLAGRDTIHEAALAWVRQELKP